MWPSLTTCFPAWLRPGRATTAGTRWQASGGSRPPTASGLLPSWRAARRTCSFCSPTSIAYSSSKLPALASRKPACATWPRSYWGVLNQVRAGRGQRPIRDGAELAQRLAQHPEPMFAYDGVARGIPCKADHEAQAEDNRAKKAHRVNDRTLEPVMHSGRVGQA